MRMVSGSCGYWFNMGHVDIIVSTKFTQLDT